MTVTNCSNKFNVPINSNDDNISSTCSLDENNEFSEYDKVFDSRVYQYLCSNDLQGVVTTYGIDTEKLFSGENMVNFVDNRSQELCTEYVNNPVYDPHDWVGVNIASQLDNERGQPSCVPCPHNNDVIQLFEEGVCIGELLSLCGQCEQLRSNNVSASDSEWQVCKISMINWVSVHGNIYVPTVYIHSTDLHKKFFTYERGRNGLHGLHCDNRVHQDMLVTSDVAYAQLKFFDNNMQGLTLSPYQTFDNYQKDIWSYKSFNMSYEQYMHNVIDDLCDIAESPKDNNQSGRVDKASIKSYDRCYGIIDIQGESMDEIHHSPQLGTGSAMKLPTSSDK